MLLLGVMASFSSCNKNEEPTTKLDYLTRAGWKPTKVEQIKNGALVDLHLSDCSKDDVYKFNTDRTLNFSVNTKCDSTDIDVNGTWELSGDEYTIIMTTAAGEVQAVSIVSLDNDNLVYSYEKGGRKFQDSHIH